MITASHNPPADNGYKLYLGDGAQIIPPADAEIEAAIAQRSARCAEVPLAAADSPLISPARRRGRAGLPGRDPARLHRPAPPGARRVAAVRLHRRARRGRRAGAARPSRGPASRRRTWSPPRPSPTPTSHRRLPQPGGARRARPGAGPGRAGSAPTWCWPTTRTATGWPSPCPTRGRRAAGGVLTGDQVGALLGDYLLDRTAAGRIRRPARGRPRSCRRRCCRRIAAAARRALRRDADRVQVDRPRGRDRPGSRFVFGYEEALGYAVGDVVRDKDGIGAALALLGLAAAARSRGESLLDAYDALETAHGVHLTAQLTCAPTSAGDVMARLRAAAPRRAGRPAGDRRPIDLTAGAADLPPPTCSSTGCRRPGGHPAQRHRAQDQGLPRGRGAGQRRAARATPAVRRRAAGRLREAVAALLASCSRLSRDGRGSRRTP